MIVSCSLFGLYRLKPFGSTGPWQILHTCIEIVSLRPGMFAEFGKVLDSVKAVQLGKHELEVGVTHVDVVSRCIPLAPDLLTLKRKKVSLFHEISWETFLRKSYIFEDV